jgi:hypothetical protein
MDFDETDNSRTTDGVGEVESPVEGDISEPAAGQVSGAVQPSGAPAGTPPGVEPRRARLAALRGRRADSTREELGDGAQSNADAVPREAARGLGIRDLAKPGAASDPIAAGRSVLARLTERLSADPSKARTAFRSALADVQRGYDALDQEIARLQAELERAHEAMRTLQRQGD